MKKINIIIYFLILISILEFLPYLITILFPNFCYSCNFIGKIHQKINTKYGISFIIWIVYLIIFLYFIYFFIRLKNSFSKFFFIFFCLFMIYLPIYPLINIITIILYLFCENTPFIYNYHNIFLPSIEIEKNADKIIFEYKNFIQNNKPECIRKSNPGFKIEYNEIKDNCWRSIYLKKIGKINDEIKTFFPNTIKLLNEDQIHNAFFSILDPGVEIPPHFGYYKGYLRYHLGIVIPNNDTNKNNDKAYIICGGEKYVWKEKEGIVFDDMFLHYVKNPTNKTRVILYIDIKRNFDSTFLNFINNIGIHLIEGSILFKLFLKNQHVQQKIT